MDKPSFDAILKLFEGTFWGLLIAQTTSFISLLVLILAVYYRINKRLKEISAKLDKK